MTTIDAYDALVPRRRTAITFALLGCAFLAMLDGTVVGTALPRIVEQIGGDGSWYVWLVTAYLLTSSVSVPVYGRFSDLYGRRRLLLGGLTVFLVASLACGLAGSMTVLIASRAVQGLGAGALLTLGMALIRDLYPPSRRHGLIRMQTVLATMMVLGMVGGPIIGGLLADHAGWRWAFWLNLPIGLAASAVLARFLPDHRPAAAPSGRLDVAGIALLATGLSLALTGLSLKGNTAAGHPPSWTDPAVARAACSAAWLCSPCSFPSSGARPFPCCPCDCSNTAPTAPCWPRASSFRSPRCRSESSCRCTSSTSAVTRPPSPAFCSSPCSSA